MGPAAMGGSRRKGAPGRQSQAAKSSGHAVQGSEFVGFPQENPKRHCVLGRRRRGSHGLHSRIPISASRLRRHKRTQPLF
jgi:hypothetical protein